MAESQALLFAGDLYVAFKNPATGIFSAAKKMECDKFEVGTPSDLLEKLSKGRSTFNQAFVSIALPKPVDFNLTLSESGREIFAMQLAGVIEDIDRAVQTLTDVAVTVVLDEWVDIGSYRNLNPVGLTVENSGGTVTYVAGTDYEINPRLGKIKALSTGSITAGPVNVSGATLATTGSRIIGARQYSHTMRLQLDGINLVTRKDMVLEAEQATVASQAAYDFLGGKLADTALKGRLEIPPNGDRPFNLDYID